MLTKFDVDLFKPCDLRNVFYLQCDFAALSIKMNIKMPAHESNGPRCLRIQSVPLKTEFLFSAH